MMASQLLLVLLALAVAGLLWTLLRAGMGAGGADFEIRHRPGRPLAVRGRVPRAKVGAIRQFFARDLGLDRPVSGRGSYGPGRVLRLRVSGDLSAGQRQQTRNFL